MVTVNLVKPAVNLGVVYGGETYLRSKPSDAAWMRAGVSASSMVVADVGIDLIPQVNNTVARITGNDYSHDVTAAALTTGYGYWVSPNSSLVSNFLISLGYNVATSMVSPSVSRMVPSELRSLQL